MSVLYGDARNTDAGLERAYGSKKKEAEVYNRPRDLIGPSSIDPCPWFGGGTCRLSKVVLVEARA
jgi:hypothetical protein